MIRVPSQTAHDLFGSVDVLPEASQLCSCAIGGQARVGNAVMMPNATVRASCSVVSGASCAFEPFGSEWCSAHQAVVVPTSR